jgi:hypothetical protein
VHAQIPGLSNDLDDTVNDWIEAEEEIHTLLGFVLALRIAGIPSETAKAMARTWRLGYPQDDER